MKGIGRMRSPKHWKGIGLVAAGLVAGYIIGPPIAEAATTLVKIESCCSTNTAAVSSTHRLAVGTSALTNTIFAFTDPGGEITVLSATGNATRSTGALNSDIVGISVDVSSGGSSPVTVVVRKGDIQGSGTIIWQGTLPANQVGHIDATFGTQSIFFRVGTNSGFNVNVTNSGGASVQYEVYGFGFGLPCCLNRQSQLTGAAGG
jgi:hypothetical protein